MTSPLRQTRLKHHTPQSYSQVVLADSPLAYWRCEDAFGAATLADSSGNGRSMTLNGTRGLQAYSKNSRLGKCVGFAFNSGYGSVAAASWFQITGDLTIELWFKTPASLASGDFIGLLYCNTSGETEATNSLYQWHYQNNGGTLRFSAFHENGSGSDNVVNINHTMDPTVWNHCVLVRDTTAKTYTVYVNGVSIGSAVYTNNPTGGTSSVLNLCRNPSDGSFGSDKAAYDEIAIYNTKLSAARIFEHYRAGRRSSATQNLWEKTMLFLPFDGADAAVTTPDQSSLGRVATFNGNAQLDTADFKSGTASLLLDGTGDYLTFANTIDHSVSGSSTDLTIEAWIKISATGRTSTITGKRSGSGAQEHTMAVGVGNQINFNAFNTSAVVTLTGTTVMTTGVWYHAAASRVGTTWYLHLNGILEASGVQSGAPSTNTSAFAVGRDAFNTSRDFQGWIDSVRFTRGVARYGAANFTPPAVFYPYE
jgi:hypothetical protein